MVSKPSIPCTFVDRLKVFSPKKISMRLFPTFLFLIICLPFSHSQLVLERDINQEAASSSPVYAAQLGDAIYFAADDGVNGEELHKYDLTTQTASLVANIYPLQDGFSTYQVKAFDNKIFFNARDGGGLDRFLYVHDPSDNSTQRLVDNMNDELRNPNYMYELDGYLYMAGEFDYNDSEFGRYNPTTNEFELIANINPDEGSSPNNFIEVNGQLWFAAQDGQSQSNLWRYDPATNSVENIMYQSVSGNFPNIAPQSYFDGKFFFQGYQLGQGSELYVYDLASNTLLDFPDIYVGAGSSSPSGFTEVDGKLFFTARTSDVGRELRVYDPATDEVTLVADIFPGNFNASPGDLKVIDGKLYFTANSNDDDRNLYSYDDDGAGLVLEATLENSISYGLSTLIAANGTLFLDGHQLEYGRELFQFIPGTNEITLAADINQTTVGSDPYGFTEYNGRLYFGATEVNSGREIWVYDPSTGNVEILSDEAGSLKPDQFTVLDGKLYFSGIDPNLGYGILSYDDATGLITPTSFITPSSTGHITDMIALNGKLYFGADTDDYGNELYVYDPTSDTWDITQDINPNGDSHAERFIVYNNEIFFQANDGSTGVELWKYNDVTGFTSLVADILPGTDDSYPEWFVVYNGELYFNARSENDGTQLFSYNGLNGIFTQRTSFQNSMNPESLTVHNNKLYFSGRYSSAVSVELLYYDAVTDSTYLTADLNPNASNPRDITSFNDKLYFATFTDNYGRELWEYNDTTSSIVADIYPGVPESDPQDLTLFNGKLYFNANDGIRGAEIWSIAECLNIIVDTEPQIGVNGFGSIDLDIQGGTPPYSITWSNGNTTEDLENLQPGTYTAIISDASGCLSEITAVVGFISVGVENLLSEDLIKIFPNPNNGNFNLEVDDLKIESVEVFDLQGKLFFQKITRKNQPSVSVNLKYAPNGIYFVKVKTQEGVLTKKIIIK